MSVSGFSPRGSSFIGYKENLFLIVYQTLLNGWVGKDWLNLTHKGEHLYVSISESLILYNEIYNEPGSHKEVQNENRRNNHIKCYGQNLEPCKRSIVP